MDIFSRFKKHYTHYFLGIIVPALVNGLSIPLLKHLIGSKAYGQYALYFNALLIANVLISGWLSQSILRFNSRFDDKPRFAAQSFCIACLLPIVCLIPAVFIVWHYHGSLLFALLFSFTLVLASLQLPLQTLTQANFRSKTILQAEALRTISWLGISLVLLWLQLPFLYSLFAATFVSYTLSIGVLYKNNSLARINRNLLADWQNLMKQLMVYGLPFSLWFVFSYLLSYVDKVFMWQHFGPEMQGNYNALFDFIAKGLVLLLAPVLTSVFPLLSEAYEKGEYRVIGTLLKKLIIYELLALVLAIIGYWAIGYKILFSLLNIPANTSYKQMGAFIIAGTLSWQLALLVQKPFELKLRSMFMLWRAIAAFTCQLIFYWLSKSFLNPILAPVGYFLAAIVYLMLVIIPLRKAMFSIKMADA